MTHDPMDSAMQRYHGCFDAAQYNALGDLLASTLYAERDDDRVTAGMNAVQDACLELSGHPSFARAWHRLAVFCGIHLVSVHVVDAMHAYLRRFTAAEADDRRLDDFEGTAKALLRIFTGLDDLGTAAAHANGVHAWQGRMAYELLMAVEYLARAAAQLLQHGDETYAHQKLRAALARITGALYEGIRHSDQPALYDFHSTYFPTERDR